eukprot:s907_g9.t2
MEAPKMQEMTAESTSAVYAGLFPDSDGDPPSMKDVIVKNKKRLKTYHWAARERKGLIVMVHGFGEHLGRYFHVASFFVKQGYEVCGMDHLAHGLSEGFRQAYGRLELEALLSCWSQFILEEVTSMEGPRPHYVYCHSTGGMVTLLALNKGLVKQWDKLKGVVYSAPLIKSPSCLATGPVAAKPILWCPGLADCCLSCGLCCCGTCCLVPGITAGQLSNYKALEEATRKDSLYFGWKVNFSMIKTLADGSLLALQQLKQPNYPFLVMVSPKDQLVDPASAKALFEQAASSTKSFETDAFSSSQHEMHNEDDWQKPLQMALQFLRSLET